MTRSTILFPALLVLACVAWVCVLEGSGRMFLPRHPAARDLPYATGPSAEAASREPFNRSMTDPVNLLVPDHVFAANNRHGFSLPSWNPYVLGGVPQPQNPLTASYDPFNPARLPMDPLSSWNVNAALRILLLGLGAWWLARRLDCDLGASAFVSIATALSGWSAAHWFNVPVLATAAWIPWILAGAVDILRGRRRVGLPVMAIAMGLMWVSGFPQVAALGTLACGVFSLALWASNAFERRVLYDFAWLALALALGLLLAAPQFATVSEFSDEVARTRMTESARHAEQYPVGALITVPFPDFLGGPKDKPIDEKPDAESDRLHLARQMFARASIGSDGEGKVPRTAGVGERMFAPGGVVLGLCLLALTCLADRRIRATLIVAIFGLLVAIVPLPDALAIPLLLNIGAPSRAIIITAMTLPLLGGLVLSRASRPSKSTLAPIVAGFIGALGLTLLLLSIISDQALAGILTDAIRGPRAQRLLQMAELPSHEVWLDAMSPLIPGFRDDIRWLGIGLTLGSMAWLIRGRLHKSVVIGLLVALVALLDCAPRFFAWNEPVRRLGAYDESPALTTLKLVLDRDDSAFIRVSDDAGQAIAEKDALLPPNTPTVHGLADVQGYREQVGSRWLNAFRTTSAFVANVGFAGIGLDQANSPVLDALSVRYLVASHELESHPAFASSGLKRVAINSPRGRDLVIYENPDARPRVEILRSPQFLDVVQDSANSIGELVDGWRMGRIPTSALFLGATEDRSSRLTEGSMPREESAETVSRSPSQHVIQANLTSPGWLLVRESFAKGFTARVSTDGGRPVDVPVVRATGIFRAIPLPRGSHHVVMSYAPPGETLGYMLTLIAMLVLIAWSFVGRDPPSAS